MTDAGQGEPWVSFDTSTSGAPRYPPGYAYGYYPPPGYAPYGYPVGPAGPAHAKPSTNIGWAIAAIFTFWPLAIPAFIYATKVDAYWFSGNGPGAVQASRDARMWGMIGVIIGAAFFVIAIVWLVFVLAIFADAVHHPA